MFGNKQYCIALYCIALRCVALRCVASRRVASRRVASHRIASYRIGESQQLIVCRSQRQGPIRDNIELRCSASRVYRSLAVAYPGFFSGCWPNPPPPAHLFFRRQRDWAGPIWESPFRPVVDTPLLVFCCLSYIKINMPLSKPSIPCVILTT